MSVRAEDLLEDGQGMESRVFRSAVDTKGHSAVDGTEVLPHLALSLGLMLDFGFHHWPAVEQRGAAYDETRMSSYINGDLLFNLGLFELAAVGLRLPVGFTAGDAFDGVDAAGEAQTAGWSTRGGLGDLALHAKLRWLRADRRPLGLGTVIQYQAPTGKPEVLMGDPAGAFAGELVIDAEPASWYRAALELGARFPLGAADENRRRAGLGEWASAASAGERLLFHYGPQLTFGLGQSLSVWPGVMDLVVEVYGNQLLTELGDRAYLDLEASVGVKVYIERSSYLMAGYGHGLPLAGTGSGYGFQSAEHRLLIGFAYEPSMGDRDRDGVKDDADQCPDEPEDFDEFDDSDGCPEPDNDRDGIPDVEDNCPLAPEDMDGDRDEDGCPDRREGDLDGDGIADSGDSCPDLPEDLDQFRDDDGCPDEDNDADLILNVEDECPDAAEDFDEWEDADGCPDPDNDEDRIPDVDDECDNDPEVRNGIDDEDGCPDWDKLRWTDTGIELLEKIYFEYEEAVIEDYSLDVIDQVAAMLAAHPEADLIEVQGHTDDRGDHEYNLDLSSDRAAAVVAQLIARGVAPERLRAMGYGKYCPLKRGRSRAAREMNRRVEFKAIVLGGAPTGVQAACERAIAAGVVPPAP